MRKYKTTVKKIGSIDPLPKQKKGKVQGKYHRLKVGISPGKLSKAYKTSIIREPLYIFLDISGLTN